MSLSAVLKNGLRAVGVGAKKSGLASAKVATPIVGKGAYVGLDVAGKVTGIDGTPIAPNKLTGEVFGISAGQGMIASFFQQQQWLRRGGGGGGGEG